jgi:hypothetical protein
MFDAVRRKDVWGAHNTSLTRNVDMSNLVTCLNDNSANGGRLHVRKFEEKNGSGKLR